MLLKAVITAFPCVSLPFLAVPLIEVLDQDDDGELSYEEFAKQVSCKALSFCCASTAFLSKTVPFLAVLHNTPVRAPAEAVGPGGARRVAVPEDPGADPEE
eukprot:SAG22_NODE_15491_length_347_cov_1.254032_1_plen_100_part_10